MPASLPVALVPPYGPPPTLPKEGPPTSLPMSLDAEIVLVCPSKVSTAIAFSYDASSLLKCTVSMTYMRYYIDRPQRIGAPGDTGGGSGNQRNLSIAEQALQNASQFLPPIVGAAAQFLF